MALPAGLTDATELEQELLPAPMQLTQTDPLPDTPLFHECVP
jgi:hypothetical protein